MSQRSPTFRVRARGPWACFTRPELRAERVSYEVMTPSAARGILEAIPVASRFDRWKSVRDQIAREDRRVALADVVRVDDRAVHCDQANAEINDEQQCK